MSRKTLRKWKGLFFLGLCTMSACTGLFWLFFILGDVFVQGIQSMNISLITQDPTPPGTLGGGMRNAIVGQLLLTFYAALIGIPIGVLGGTFLAEYARRTRLAKIISILADIMVSIPTIVLGTFIYAILVKPWGHFSGWAGAVALAIIMIPVILRTTQDILGLVSETLREAAFALGAPYYKIILQVVYPRAANGILTGILLSIARIAGETAPLLFTSFNNAFFTLDMNQPMASMTVTIFNYAMGPYPDWHSQAWAAAFLITLFILLITILGRYLIKFSYQ